MSAVSSTTDMLACGLFEDELDDLAELLAAHESPKVRRRPSACGGRCQLSSLEALKSGLTSLAPQTYHAVIFTHRLLACLQSTDQVAPHELS